MFGNRVSAGLLCGAAFVFPFSVAATNAVLAVAIVLSLASGQWAEGVKVLWKEYRGLATALSLYLGLMLLGLLWSNNPKLGLSKVAHQWFWLAIPGLVAVLADAVWRKRFLFSLSLGLALHLALCVLQMFGYVQGTRAGGSGMEDPTGHIGHIGFGFVYGLWAAWLLHMGWSQAGKWRLMAWLLALWAWVMIFFAQGRSGYLISLVLLLLVTARHYLSGYGWKRTVTVLGFSALMLVALALGPGKQRLNTTWNNLQAIQQGDLKHAGGRWSLWLGAVEVWKKHPWLGVGTGGYEAAASQVFREHPEYIFKANHPHNSYLLALDRWGVVGLAVLLALLLVWVRTGWQADWIRHPVAPLVALSGIALAIHGLSSSALEEHFSALMAMFMLGAGLSDREMLTG